jgi:hypothetical protein
MGFCCLLQDCKCINSEREKTIDHINAFKYIGFIMVKKVYQNPKGGLNQKGREYFNRKEGSNLKAPVKSGTNPRRVSFAARFGNMKGSLLNKNGDPTRLKLALKAWGFGSKEAARKFAARHKKS